MSIHYPEHDGATGYFIPPLFLDRQGQSISAEGWIHHRHDPEYVQVGNDTDGHILVSTVWIGLVTHPEAPLTNLFETIIFDHGHSFETWSWNDEQAALEGHKHLVETHLSPRT